MVIPVVADILKHNDVWQSERKVLNLNMYVCLKNDCSIIHDPESPLWPRAPLTNMDELQSQDG